jgi:putative ABC transport system permease protein
VTASRFVRIAHQRLRALAQPRDLDREIDRELALHLDLLVEEKRAGGLSDEAALREARREFGDLARLTERSRDARGLTWLSDLRQDARYGLRLLRRSPGFTTIASLALALGIGATAAVAGAIGLVLARPLPFPQADRIITIQPRAADGTLQRQGLSPHDYLAWRARSRTIEQMGAALSGPRNIGPEPGGASADRVPGQAFTPSRVAVLGVPPQAGHLFEDTDDPYSRTALVVVISHHLWQRRYGGAGDTVGREMIVDGAPRRIVGIMGPDFRYPNDATELWTPLVFARDAAASRTTGMLAVTARLRPGVTTAQVQAELGSAVGVVPIRQALYGWTKPRLLTLAAAVILVLILACANVAGLLLARGAMRHREVAMRIALGATPARIVRQLVTESLVLGLGAGALGVAVAWPGVSAVRGALGAPPGVPRVGPIDLDGWVLAAIVVLSVVSSLACGLVPALAEGRTARGRHGRYRFSLVAAQIALAQVLLVGAALLSISFFHLDRRVMNLDPRGLLTFDFAVRPGEFVRPLGSEDGVPAFQISPLGTQTIARVYERLRAVDGAAAVAGISYPPVNSLVVPAATVRVADGRRAGRSTAPLAAFFVVTPDLFAILRTPIVRGREFDARDSAGAPWTIVINETLARLCFPGLDPIGHRLRIDAGPDERIREVVGVVADVPTRRDRPEPQPVMYASYLQYPAHYRGPAPGMFGGMTFVMRPASEGSEVLAAVHRAVADVAPDRPVVNVGSLEAHFSALMAERRNYVAALAAFAIAASLLAVVGLYGAMAYEVQRRTGEIAVRKALGARSRDLVVATGRPALLVGAAGILSGVAAALPLARLLAPQLWGISASDPLTFISTATGLAAAVLLGCLGPLRRSLAVDPALRLRSE